MKPLGVLHLRGMAEIGKFDQFGVGDQPRGVFAEFRIIAELGAQFGRREILADRRIVLVADEQQRRTARWPSS